MCVVLKYYVVKIIGVVVNVVFFVVVDVVIEVIWMLNIVCFQFDLWMV